MAMTAVRTLPSTALWCIRCRLTYIMRATKPSTNQLRPFSEPIRVPTEVVRPNDTSEP